MGTSPTPPFVAVGALVHERVRRLLGNTSAARPGVHVSCLYSLGVRTPLSFEYAAEGAWDATPRTHTGDGDGTVNARSLRVCEHWRGEQVQVKTFRGVTHEQMLTDASVLAELLSIVRRENARENHDYISPGRGSRPGVALK